MQNDMDNCEDEPTILKISFPALPMWKLCGNLFFEINFLKFAVIEKRLISIRASFQCHGTLTAGQLPELPLSVRHLSFLAVRENFS